MDTPESLWNDLRPLVRDITIDRRIALHAQALMDILVWHLYVKFQGCSMTELLGIKRWSVPMLAIARYYTAQNALSVLTQEIQNLMALGLVGVKIELEGLRIEQHISRIRPVRETAKLD